MSKTLTLIVAHLIWTSSLFAQAPTADFLFPAGAQIGSTFELEVGGKFPSWPKTKVWTDAADLQFTPQEKGGKFEVQVGKSVETGPHWIRFFNSQGASDLVPLLIGSHAETKEQEPNESPQTAHRVELPHHIDGRLVKSGDVDTFVVHLKRSEALTATVTANHLFGSPMDVVLQVCSPQGIVLHQVDDTRGIDPQIHFTASEEGDVCVRVFAFPEVATSTIGFAGATNFVYRLTLSNGPVVSSMSPLIIDRESQGAGYQATGFGGNFNTSLQFHTSPDSNWGYVTSSLHTGWLELPVGTATKDLPTANGTQFTSPIPANITGQIAAKGEVDRYLVEVEENSEYQLKLTSRALGFPLDAVLEIRDGEGNVVLTIDDTSKLPDPSTNWKTKKTGTYEISIKDLHSRGGSRYHYLLQLKKLSPDFRVTTAVQQITGTVGTSTDLELNVERTGGFDQNLKIAIGDDASGPSIKAPSIKAPSIKTPSIKTPSIAHSKKTTDTVTLKFDFEEAGYSGPLSLWVESETDPNHKKPVTFSVKGTQREFSQLWLTVLEKEKVEKN